MGSFSFTFFVRKDKKRSDGTVPIYLRITYNKAHTDISLKRHIDPDRWDPARGQMRGSKRDAIETNEYITLLSAKLNKIYAKLSDSGNLFTLKMIRNELEGNTKKRHGLVETFSNETDRIGSLVGNGYALNTHKRYKSTLVHVKTFLSKHYGQDEIDMSAFTLSHIRDFEVYLKKEKGCNHNTTLKYITIVKRIFRMALKNEWISRDPFVNYNEKYKKCERDYLTTSELQAIKEKKFATERLDKVRDIFLFCCYTGLSYADVWKMTATHLVTGIDGETWIDINRTKTGGKSRIPLLDGAAAILEKYAELPGEKLLPVSSNQKLNDYLKEIAEVCGITKNLTFHVSRHTFATLVITMGVSTESVQKYVGAREYPYDAGVRQNCRSQGGGGNGASG